MPRNICVEPYMATPIEKQQIELVERKGVGHPDSIADGLAESVSRALCKEYIDKCGGVLHHNTDETQIVAGRSIPKFGGGQVIQPIYILLVGRATKDFQGIDIPTDTIALKTARNYLKNTLPSLDVDSDVILDCKFGRGSSDLTHVFGRDGKMPVANDTSFGVGHAPFSELEQIVYNTERSLIEDFKKKKGNKYVGEDMKVMGLRNGDDITLTICSGLVGKYVDDIGAYVNCIDEMKDYVLDLVPKYTDRNVDVMINTADEIEKESVFLTVTGTSAEMGDDGSVGRGNRSNGLITPNRPMSMEATSGKNPINHIGKIYNLLATQIARQIAVELDDVDDVYVKLLSQIGHPIDQPLIASAQIVTKPGAKFDSVRKEAEGIVDEWLANTRRITEMVAKGELDTF
ncbi:methionine adenosyltransferase [Methanolapillus millepedarum]|uniref:S-adenosylmethionine synthase n=1 Tax=Methanolapillus millepedarum TaxID=3028296 RepID=A0AA97A491_9EURY|nr:S-adenosylmethionine synthase [Methanosarcinaceae archaeon Ac7]